MFRAMSKNIIKINDLSHKVNKNLLNKFSFSLRGRLNFYKDKKYSFFKYIYHPGVSGIFF